MQTFARGNYICGSRVIKSKHAALLTVCVPGRSRDTKWGLSMLISAAIAGFFILGLFFQMLSSSPPEEQPEPVRSTPPRSKR